MGGTPQFPVLGDVPLLPEVPPRPSFAQRIQRSHDLAERYPAAAEVLSFYARLAFHQEHVFEVLSKTSEEKLSGQGSWPLLTDVALPLLSPFARAISEVAPSALRQHCLTLSDSDAVTQANLLTSFWESGFAPEANDTAAADRVLALAFLQPYAEWLAQTGHSYAAPARHATCPVCASEPVCSVLRDRGQGAGRSLVCSLCMNEWTFLRVACPSCGEDRFESLPIFTPEAIPQVRVDACDTCHTYIKTIDMTRDGLAVPIVDELAALSLDLWALEHGYRKLSANLAGL